MNYQLEFPLFPALLCLILFIFTIYKKCKNSNSPKLPSGPRKLPIIGNMLQLTGNVLHRRLRDLSDEFGPIMHLQVGQISSIIISSPEFAKEILKTHDINFAQRPPTLAAQIITYNFNDIAFGSHGDIWRQLRKICILELLSSKRVLSFRSIREEEVFSLVKLVTSKSGSVINLSKMAFYLSNNITSRTSFGKIFKQKDEFLEIVKKITLNLEGFTVVDIFPSLKFLQVITGMKYRLEKLHLEADLILENIIKDHKERRVLCKDDLKNDEKDDLVDVFLNVQEHGNLEFPLTEESIKAVMLDMFVAGTETSSTTVEWAMSELIKNPRVMKKAQEEIRQIINQKNHIINENCLQEFKYLKLVIKETLRLHPPIPLLLPRECREKVELNEYEIPTGTRIIVNAWAIGRDSRYWKEPEKFYPERFLNKSIDYMGNNFEFIPFGAGRRSCPGMSYGMVIVELLLANLLYHFDWNLPDGLKSEELDMTECFGSSVRRENQLHLIPKLCHP